MRDYTPKGPPPSLGYIAQQCDGVRCTCLDCRHYAVLPIAGLLVAFGEERPFPSITKRFRCKGCGSKNVHVTPDWPDPLAPKKKEAAPKGGPSPADDNGRA